MHAALDTKLPLATGPGLYHTAIKTENLAGTRKFYVDILGLREFPRPDFGYPGAWIGCTQPGGLAIMHIYAGGAGAGGAGAGPRGQGAGRNRCDRSRLAVVLGLSLLCVALQGGRPRLARIHRAGYDALAII